MNWQRVTARLDYSLPVKSFKKIFMIQKILRVGSSAAVTIPKHSLQELGLAIGDKVVVEVDRRRQSVQIMPTKKQVKIDSELLEWTRKFIERYRPALEALAKR